MSLFEVLVENSPDVTSLISARGEVLYTSAASTRVFGYLPQELVGRSAFDLVHPDDQPSLRWSLQKVLVNPLAPRRVEARVQHKNGQWCWVESTISNLLEEPGVSAIVINCRESGAKRALREQLQHRTDELTRSNAQLDYFAYAVAHDLRQPLRAISMLTELLAEEAYGDEAGKLIKQHIVDGVARISTLFEGLRAFAVSGFDDLPHPVNLGLVVTQTLQNLAYAIAGSGAIVTADPMPWVRSHENPLLTVFQNLIMNALKYHGAAPPRIHLSAEPLGQQWIIRVKDNGIGIPPECQERIFLLVRRLDGAETPGAGMGLAICQRIIKASGGLIWVESEAGVGSTFCFSLPAAKPGTISALPGGRKNLAAGRAPLKQSDGRFARTKRAGSTN